MSDDWKWSKLADHIDLTTGFPFQSAGYTDEPVDTRLLRGDNIGQGFLRWSGVKRWSAEDAHSFPEYLLQEGDVVLAMDRPWIEAGLKFAAISAQDLPCLLVQRVARLRGMDRLETGFLRYLIASRGFTNHVLSVQTGTAVPHISASQIGEFEFKLPPLDEQRWIASVLGALDEKIGSNRVMNETLEGMARAIFKSWFVDFDPIRAKMEGRDPLGIDADIATAFPERLTVTDLGEIPEGWKVGRLDDLVSISRRAITPLNAPDDLFDHHSIPAFDDGKRPVRQRGEEIKSNKFLIKKGCVLVSRLNPRIPRVWLPDPADDVQSVCSTEFAVANPLSPFTTEFIYSVLSSFGFQEHLATLVTGTSGSHQRVKPADLQQMPVIVPDSRIVHVFSEIVAPVLMRISGNIAESATLATLRDLLLPKLMSGEVRIRDAEQRAEAAL